MQTHPPRPRARRHTLLALTTTAALAAPVLAGCGEVGPTERDDDFATYSAKDVQKRFKEVTGVPLKQSTGTNTLQFLRVEAGSGNTRVYDRYGGARITVTGNKKTLESITKQSAGGERKIIDNVVIENSGSSDGEKAYARVVRVLSSLGKPADTVKLPAEDTPCEKAGIDLESADGKEGTCKGDRQQTVQVVNSGSDLELPGKTISATRTRIGSVLTSRRYGLTRRFRAKGDFVAVAYKVENTGDEPLSSVRPELVVDGKRYSEDSRHSFYLSGADTFPLQPGETGGSATLFDVPEEVARKIESGGLLEVSGDEQSSSVEFSEKLGLIRLGQGVSKKALKGLAS